MSSADNAVISLALLVVACLPVWLAFKVVPLTYDRLARPKKSMARFKRALGARGK
jgi:hypothetical protein